MKLKSSHLFAVGIVGALALYLVIRLLVTAGEARSNEPKAAPQRALPTVQVLDAPTALHPYAVVLRGRTAAARTVVVRSETAGVVAATPTAEGGFVRRGEVLCRLALDARKATLDQARAALRSRQLQHQASAELAAKGFRSQTQVLQDKASLDAAAAGVRQAEIALEQVNIRAPFAGVFDQRDAEIGSYLAPGQACGTMIELDPLLIVGDAPEAEAQRVAPGAAASARLLDGRMISGTVRYVAREADPQTRTYRIEIVAPNPGSAIRSGLSAEVRLAAGQGPANLVPVAALVLDSAGRQGVRHVGPEGRVMFSPVQVLEETAGGVWVGGLPGPVRVITVGQSYVAEGQKVRVAAPATGKGPG
ncbi:MAG: efflux RND transporter periplasmic adaptor subunit [Phenylobacterium sp.]